APAEFADLRVRQPRLWWPNGYGDPALHELTITAATGRTESDRKQLQFGIRQFDYQYDVPIQVDPVTDSTTQTVNFPEQTARYVRIRGGRRATGWGISMWTLAVLDSTDPGTDFALHSTATASSIDNPGDTAPNAVDGNPKTRWSSNYSDNQWIQLDL